MKLSNFEWTDKESVKWFILMPSGHEGPYSLKSLRTRLDQKSISSETKIWAEGLPDALTLKTALYHFEAAKAAETNRAPLKLVTEVAAPVKAKPAAKPIPTPAPVIEPEIPVFIPPVPVVKTAPVVKPPPQQEVKPQYIEEDEIPPLPPLPDEDEVEPGKTTAKRRVFPVVLMFLGVILFTAYLGYSQWLRGQEKFSIRRYPKMSLELQERIMGENQFDGWDKKIFFKEYVPSDLSSIWFVSTGYQTCQVEARFQAIKGKTLSMSEEAVSFTTRGVLKDHVVEFNKFQFESGQRLVPALYEVDIKASDCAWDGLTPRMAAKFENPDAAYVTRVKMILFPKGPAEFNALLDKLVRKKTDIVVKAHNKDELFWQSMTEKLQTLLAINMQVEQFFTELLDQDARKFDTTIKAGVTQYTKQFGHVLTNFVISNENDFKEMPLEQVMRVSGGENYERLIRITSKDLGLESMKIIEKLQGMKKPKRVTLNAEKKKISTTFTALREKITQKLNQIEEKQEKPR